MSSQAKVVARVLGEELEKFEADNICLKQTSIKRMGGQMGHRSEFTEWYDVPYIATTVDGLSITQYNEKTGLAVPHRVNVYASVPFKLTNTDTLDSPENMRIISSAFQAIDNRINRAVATAVLNQGSQFVPFAAAISNFSHIAAIDTLLGEQDIPASLDKTLIMNYGDGNSVANDLQGTGRTMSGIAKTAYEKALVSQVGGLDIFKTSFAPTKAAAAGGGAITVNGANQDYDPVGHTLDSDGNPTNVDNRTQTLTVSATTNVAVGDKFTLAGVNALSLQNKNDTGNLRTFTVTEVVSGTELRISPPIIVDSGTPNSTVTQARDDYANCSAAPANGAAVTFLNTQTAQSNLFWVKDAVCINVAPVVGSEDDLGGIIVMNETTDLGLNVVVAKQGSINDLSTNWRVTTFFGTTVTIPEMCGTLFGGQT